MKKFTLITVITAAIAVAGCQGSHSASDKVAMAEMVMAENDVVATRKICDGIMADSVTRKGLEATEMARLSILYMELNERTDDHEAVDIAADCYRDAFDIDADSARSFYDSLEPDKLKYAMALSSIVSSMDNPNNLEDAGEHDHEFADSI